MFYSARYYSPLLSRFISADTIVPGAGNSQAFNRYMYVLGNPLKFMDPSGHDPCGGQGVQVEDCGVDDWQGVDYYEWQNEVERMRMLEARKTLEWLSSILETIASIVSEPIDWAVTGSDCLAGNCSVWMGLALLPLVPGSVGDDIGQLVQKTLRDRIVELNNLRRNPFSRQLETTAILRTIDEGGNVIDLVAHSLGKLTDEQVKMLLPGEVAVPYNGIKYMDAEQRALQYAAGSVEFGRLSPLEVAASRPICPECARLSLEAGAIPVSPLKSE